MFCINSSRVISPFSIKSFASASVCARLETRSSCIVTGLLSGSAIVLLTRLSQDVWWNRHTDLLAVFKARRNGTRAKGDQAKDNNRSYRYRLSIWVHRPNVSIVGECIHGFKTGRTHSVAVRAVFVIVNEIIACFVCRLAFLRLHFPCIFCHLGPYGRRLQIDAWADELIGLGKRFLGDGVLATVVCRLANHPVCTLACHPTCCT